MVIVQVVMGVDKVRSCVRVLEVCVLLAWELL